MSRSMLLIVLGLSLIFNVFFLLGRFGPGTVATADPAERLAQSLDLTQLQRTRFDELRTELQVETAAPRARIAQLQQALADELETESPDIDRVRDLTDQIAGERRSARALAADHLGSFIDMLDPDQRRRLGRRLGEASRRHHPPLPDLTEFDVNGDGEIDQSEHEAARKLVHQRHEELRQRRQAMAEEFDADGDGTLSPDERRAFREALLERGLHHPRRGPRGERRGPGGKQPHEHPPHDHPPHGGPGSDGPPPPA
ncbi:MAG: periplasmic heavy metal sensor [Phycisphaerales bacterium]|nr:periplasmic heavy metal sensor [Phycisphaerales bacterium]